MALPKFITQEIKDIAGASERDKVNWYADQLDSGLSDAEIRARVNEVLGTSFSGDEPDWKYLRQQAAEPITPEIAKDLIQRSMTTGVDTAAFDKYGGYDAVKSVYDANKGSYNLADQTLAQLQNAAGQITDTGVGNKAVLDLVQPASQQQQQQQQQQQPGTDYQSTVTGGSGVDFKGSTGLREAYGPYALDFLSRASALLALRDSPDYQPIKFGTAEKGGTYGAGTANTLSNLQAQRESMMSGDKAFKPYQYSFVPKPAARGGIMSLGEKYDAGGTVGGMQGSEVIPSAFDSPAAYSPTTITSGTFDATQRDKYMSPYTSGVVDPQVREAKRQAQLATQTQAAKATQAGAFGGTRGILAENEIGRNLATQIGDIYGKGQQEAFLNAQQQFERDQARNLEAQKVTEQSKQFGANYGLQTAQSEAQYQQQARQLQQQAEEAAARGDQFAASLALQQLQEANRAAESARAFEYTQARDTYLDPYRELGYASQLLTGLPISSAATGISPATEAIISMLGLSNVLGVGGTPKKP